MIRKKSKKLHKEKYETKPIYKNPGDTDSMMSQYIQKMVKQYKKIANSDEQIVIYIP